MFGFVNILHFCLTEQLVAIYELLFVYVFIFGLLASICNLIER